MLCYVMLCYVMLCYVMLCYVMLCYVMLCYVMLCYVMLCYVMLCYVMLCYVMLCYVMLCYVMLCYVMLCYVMLCYVMLCYVIYICIESGSVQSSETTEFVRQNTQTFHDLNKVQRQILHPVPASMTDSFSLAANIKHKDSAVKVSVARSSNNATAAVHNEDKHFSDLQLPGTVILFIEKHLD